MKMPSVVRVCLVLALLAMPAAAFGQEMQSEIEYYREQERLRQEQEQPKAVEPPVAVHQPEAYHPYEYKVDRGAINPEYVRDYRLSRVECGDGEPANAFVVIPQYFHSRNDKARFKVGGQHLKMGKSKANGGGVAVAYNRKVTDWFSFAVMYEYAFMNVSGGMAYPDNPLFDGARESSRWETHVVGILPKFDFQKWGRLELSYLQGFDRARGNETMFGPGGPDRRDVDDYGLNVTALTAWYEVDFGFCGNWKLTPYAGWRSLYVDIKDQNNWGIPAGNPGAKSDSNTWVHLASAGVKLGYQNGPFGFMVRGGVSHRNTHDDIPGYGNRAVAPGIVHISHRANLDRTVGTVGAAISYAAHKRLVVSVGYDGFFGADTSAHIGSLSFAIPF